MENQDSTILLVEDNADDEALLLRALRKNQIHHQVVVARDGAEALDYLFGRGSFSGRDIRKQPRLVLLDLKLPKMGGLEVLEQIRADERTRLLAVVVLTTSSEDSDVISSYRLGANSYIRKPVDFSLFTEAVRQLNQYWMGLNLSPPSRA